MKKIQLFLLNAVIMTATSLTMSSIGVWFNLYISNKIGAQGMGVYQLIMSVYTFAVTLAASGINLAATRLVAEELGKGHEAGVKRVMRRCLVYCLLFGSLSGALLFFGAHTIGAVLLKNPLTVLPLRVMAFSMPFISMCCAINGYFTAVRRIVKNAVSQVFEMAVKITLTIFCLSFLVPDGLDYACLAVVVSGAVSEILSFFCFFTLYLFDRRRYRKGGSSDRLTRSLLGIALPVAVSCYIRSGLSTVKNLLVPFRLQSGGVSSGDAFAVFGTVQGVVMPVIAFPSAFLNSFSNLIVPELAERRTQHRNVNHIVNRMLQLNLFFAFGVSGILFSFPAQIGAMVSSNPDVGVYIRLLAPVIPILYLDTAVDCMLKGLGEQVSVMRYNMIDAFLSLIMVYLLLPLLGIKGYILVICMSEVFNFSLSMNRLIKVTCFKIDVMERVIKPFLCIAISTVSVKILLNAGLLPTLAPTATAAVLIGLSGGGYFLLILLSGYQKCET